MGGLTLEMMSAYSANRYNTRLLKTWPNVVVKLEIKRKKDLLTKLLVQTEQGATQAVNPKLDIFQTNFQLSNNFYLQLRDLTR
jgi:hypothetical protein